MIPELTPLEKEKKLKSILEMHGAVVIAYSGGVDSTYLADVAQETLGEKAHLVIADSPSIPRDELKEAQAIAQQRGWNLALVKTHEFDHSEFLQNDVRRCYYCKSELFQVMRTYADRHSIPIIAYGETAEDHFDPTRTGAIAAREQRACAPLAEAGFNKNDIRERSRIRNLPTWNKPSFACLASRVPTGNPINADILARIEKAETLLHDLGCRQYRARHHDHLCRIEVDPEDMPLLLRPDIRLQVVERLHALGYRYVTLDLGGYRTGSSAGNAQ